MERLRDIDKKALLNNIAMITSGSLILAAGIKSIVVPQNLISGGVTGIALILHYLHPSSSLGLLYFILNIPLLIIGWFSLGKRFMGYTAFGMVVFSSAFSIRVPEIGLNDPLLAGIFGGVVCGFGAGIILRSLGSVGGFDILAIVCNLRFGIRVGLFLAAANALVLLAGGIFIELEKALYSIVYVYAFGRVVDMVMAGFNRRKMALIISSEPERTADFILNRIKRGVTFLKGKGAYTGTERNVLLTVTTLTELPRLKEAVFSIDPDAFVIINDTLEVLGKRHGKRKVYQEKKSERE